jgi:hypothetical protein
MCSLFKGKLEAVPSCLPKTVFRVFLGVVSVYFLLYCRKYFEDVTVQPPSSTPSESLILYSATLLTWYYPSLFQGQNEPFLR